MTSENHSGIIWGLAALIVLTLSGVFLAMLADKHHNFSHSRNIVAREISENEFILDGLRDELAGRARRLDSSGGGALQTAAELARIEKRNIELKDEIASLVPEKKRIQAAIPDIEQAFSEDRRKYREAVWAKAAGERIDSLFLKSGRQFERIIITRVTPFGLEISHSHGNARVDFKDLSNDYRERFQWVENEQEEVLANERRNRLKLSPPQQEPESIPIQEPMPDTGDDPAIAALRSEIQLLRSKISSLKSEHANASTQSRYSSNRSVPGSLRTWGEQATILAASIARAEARLTLVSEKLRALSPGDAVLSVPR